MLILENINVTLGKGSPLERKILQNLNFCLAQSEFVVIIGGNGAGKSTLFNLISGFIKPDSGNIIIDNKNVTLLPQNTRAPFIAKVMQDPRIGTMENMTILENLAFAFKRGNTRGLLPFSNGMQRSLFQDKLAMLKMGLENRLGEKVTNLSGGQRQALSIIMAVIADSKILLLDEITAALDPKTAQHIIEFTNMIIREEKRSCIMITHDMNQAIKYGDRTLLLKDGKFIKEFNKCEKKLLTTSLLITHFEESI